MNPIIFQNWLNISSKNFNKGVNFGHKSLKYAKTSFLHPLQSHYSLGVRENVSIFSTQQSLKSMLRAFHIIGLILKKKGRILIINTNPEFFKLCNNITQLSVTGQSLKTREFQNFQTSQLSYICYKWVGGTLTNWKQLSKSVLTYAKFSQRCEKFLITNEIDFPKYSKVKKCFQGLLHKENKKMLLAFAKKPDLLFMINPEQNKNILNEAYLLHIPVVGLTESSTNLKEITYPIPVNNYSIKFIYFCLKKLVKMISL